MPHARRAPTVNRSLRFALTCALVLLGTSGGCDGKSVELGPDFHCKLRPHDERGYLRPICQYIAANFDSYPVDPNTLRIVSTARGDVAQYVSDPQYASASYAQVALDCCYTGDIAVLEIATKAVVEFYVGDL